MEMDLVPPPSPSTTNNWQGAEAKVYIGKFGGNFAIYKQRIKKLYRNSILDERLNSRRIVQETRCIIKAWKSGVKTPAVYFVDPKVGLLIMEYIRGKTAKETIINDEIPIVNDEGELLGKSIGQIIARLHSSEIIHGDLTTSNIIISNTEPVLIDFGLSCVSNSVEDRAVDLYVLERAILSTHPSIGPTLFTSIIQSYAESVSNSKDTLSKLAQVQLRGRKRDMIG